MKSYLHDRNEWEQTIGWFAASPTVKLPDLLSIVAEATRQLCANFPEHDCHNPSTNNYSVASKVVAHLAACLTARPANMPEGGIHPITKPNQGERKTQ